jgi:hypothetical protein
MHSNRYCNKDENVHRFALIAIRGELLERERDSFGIKRERAERARTKIVHKNVSQQ